jgi:hypothetical protein
MHINAGAHLENAVLVSRGVLFVYYTSKSGHDRELFNTKLNIT